MTKSFAPSRLIVDKGEQNGGGLLLEYVGPLVSVPVLLPTESFAVVPLPSSNLY